MDESGELEAVAGRVRGRGQQSSVGRRQRRLIPALAMSRAPPAPRAPSMEEGGAAREPGRLLGRARASHAPRAKRVRKQGGAMAGATLLCAGWESGGRRGRPLWREVTRARGLPAQTAAAVWERAGVVAQRACSLERGGRSAPSGTMEHRISRWLVEPHARWRASGLTREVCDMRS